MKAIIKIVSPFLVLIIFGTVGYAIIEGWSIFEGLFMTVVNVIALGGLGEIKAISPQGRMFTLILKIGSLTLIIITFYIFIRAFIKHVSIELSDQWKFYTTGNKKEKIHLLYFQKSVVGHAGRLYDRMAEYFGRNRLSYWDISGDDSKERELTKSSEIFSNRGLSILILGEDWEKKIDNKSSTGSLSLFVKKMIKRNMPIFPVLVQGAKIPSVINGNKVISELARFQGFSISDIRWKDELEQLIETIDKEIIFSFYGASEKVCSKTIKIENEGRRYKNYIRLFAKIWIACTIIGAAGYYFVEGWSFFDSIYMTIMNVVAFGGLGELHPTSIFGRLVTLIFKIVSVIAAFGLITNFLRLQILHQKIKSSNFNEQLNNTKKIFVSYRRADASGHTGRLYDHLIQYFFPQNIFIDIDSIQPGDDFLRRIQHFLDNSDVFLAVVGKNWLGKTKDGQRRIDNKNDFVRIELLEAIGKKIPIIAVLVQGVQEAELDWLPDNAKFEGFYKSIHMDDFAWNKGVKNIYRTIVSLQNETLKKSA